MAICSAVRGLSCAGVTPLAVATAAVLVTAAGAGAVGVVVAGSTAYTGELSRTATTLATTKRIALILEGMLY